MIVSSVASRSEAEATGTLDRLSPRSGLNTLGGSLAKADPEAAKLPKGGRPSHAATATIKILFYNVVHIALKTFKKRDIFGGTILLKI